MWQVFLATHIQRPQESYTGSVSLADDGFLNRSHNPDHKSHPVCLIFIKFSLCKTEILFQPFRSLYSRAIHGFQRLFEVPITVPKALYGTFTFCLGWHNGPGFRPCEVPKV